MNKSDASSVPSTLTKELVVQNKMGIHARPAAMVVRITNKFKADVFVEKDDEQVNGKSIMGLMMLAAGKGSKVKFVATGADAAAGRGERRPQRPQRHRLADGYGTSGNGLERRGDRGCLRHAACRVIVELLRQSVARHDGLPAGECLGGPSSS